MNKKFLITRSNFSVPSTNCTWCFNAITWIPHNKKFKNCHSSEVCVKELLLVRRWCHMGYLTIDDLVRGLVSLYHCWYHYLLGLKLTFSVLFPSSPWTLVFLAFRLSFSISSSNILWGSVQIKYYKKTWSNWMKRCEEHFKELERHCLVNWNNSHFAGLTINK